MKANEEPKVLYLQPDSSHPAGKRYLNLNKVSDNDIEYIRKDAFIEKAVNWLKHSLDNGCWVANDVGEQEKKAIIEHFKETMKLKE